MAGGGGGGDGWLKSMSMSSSASKVDADAPPMELVCAFLRVKEGKGALDVGGGLGMGGIDGAAGLG